MPACDQRGVDEGLCIRVDVRQEVEDRLESEGCNEIEWNGHQTLGDTVQARTDHSVLNLLHQIAAIASQQPSDCYD